MQSLPGDQSAAQHQPVNNANRDQPSFRTRTSPGCVHTPAGRAITDRRAQCGNHVTNHQALSSNIEPCSRASHDLPAMLQSPAGLGDPDAGHAFAYATVVAVDDDIADSNYAAVAFAAVDVSITDSNYAGATLSFLITVATIATVATVAEDIGDSIFFNATATFFATFVAVDADIADFNDDATVTFLVAVAAVDVSIADANYDATVAFLGTVGSVEVVAANSNYDATVSFLVSVFAVDDDITDSNNAAAIVTFLAAVAAVAVVIADSNYDDATVAFLVTVVVVDVSIDDPNYAAATVAFLAVAPVVSLLVAPAASVVAVAPELLSCCTLSGTAPYMTDYNCAARLWPPFCLSFCNFSFCQRILFFRPRLLPPLPPRRLLLPLLRPLLLSLKRSHFLDCLVFSIVSSVLQKLLRLDL